MTAIHPILDGSVLWGQIWNAWMELLLGAAESAVIQQYTSLAISDTDSYPDLAFMPPFRVVQAGGNDVVISAVELVADQAFAGVSVLQVGNNVNPGAAGFESISVTLSSGARVGSNTGTITFTETNYQCVVRATTANNGHAGITMRGFQNIT